MYLLDTEFVSELRRERPHQDALDWFVGVAPDQVYLSAVTVGEIQAGIEFAHAKEAAEGAAGKNGSGAAAGTTSEAEKLESWLGKLIDTRRILPMDPAVFRVWGRLFHRRWDIRMTDAMIAATAMTHRLTVVTGNPESYDRLGVETLNPYEHAQSL